MARVRAGRGDARRPLSAVWPAATAAAILGYGLWLRGRIARFEVLTDTDEPVAAGHRFLVAGGVRLDPATARAASLHARRHGLEVVDLVPADLPTERLLDLARRVDPRAFRDDPLALGVGAGCALLVTDDVVRRAEIDLDGERDEVDLLDVVRTLSRYAPLASAHALAPHLRAPTPGDDAGWRRAALEAFFSLATPAALTLRGAQVAALATLATRGRAGAAVAAAHALQLPVAVAGTAARPRDLTWRTLLRVPAAARDLLLVAHAGPAGRAGAAGTARAHARRADRARVEADGRAAYRRDLDRGIDHLFEPRRTDCPLCASTDLSVRLRLGDLFQRKPGVFTLEQCGGCRHVFQNPTLTVEGLDVYYRDFYDGAGEEQMELAFASERDFYRRRVEMVARHTEPRRWLDVGGGHGHFCLSARATWPKTAFDAIDLASSIDDAERRGWLDRGLRGMFPDLAPGLAESYDVVSMHHYLEHTRDPAAELDAARTVLEPGGLLLIEMPDPESLLARLLGQWWGAYLQPQHLHMPPLSLLESMLEARGFTVVERHRAEAHQRGDLTGATYLAVNRWAPPVDVPWRAASTPTQRLRRTAALTAAVPVLAAAAATDQVMGALLAKRVPLSNAYRVLARRDS